MLKKLKDTTERFQRVAIVSSAKQPQVLVVECKFQSAIDQKKMPVDVVSHAEDLFHRLEIISRSFIFIPFSLFYCQRTTNAMTNKRSCTSD